MSKENFNLSDFMSMEVIRTKDVAEIIFDHNEGGMPIRLLGFETEASKSDYEVREEAYGYWKLLIEEIDSL